MCTALTYHTQDYYFGRTLDLFYNYGETVTVTPRNYGGSSHYAMIGTAFVYNGRPLYYDCINEKGLAIAALNFPADAYYQPYSPDIRSIASFDVIPRIMNECADANQAYELLSDMVIDDRQISDELPNSTLHWIVYDCNRCFVVEPLKEGLVLVDNPVGVMTNSPCFTEHLDNLKNYSQVSNCTQGLGLPGSHNSPDRFVRAAFHKESSPTDFATEKESVNQFFKIMGTVTRIKGAVLAADGSYDRTIYTSCCNISKGIYYYTDYDNSQIRYVDMHKENLDGDTPINYPLITEAIFTTPQGG